MANTTVVAHFAARFRLEDTRTGALLLDERISGSGVGQGRVTPGDARYNRAASVDYSYGVEQALSDAMTRTIAEAMDRIIDAIAIQRESGTRDSTALKTP